MSNAYEFTIKGRYAGNYCLISLNQLLGETAKHPKAGNRMKQKYEEIVGTFARKELKNKKFENPVQIHYIFGEPDKRRDYSNVVSGAIKVIEDALQKYKYLKNDNQKWVKPYTYEFSNVPKGELPFVKVIIKELDNND